MKKRQLFAGKLTGYSMCGVMAASMLLAANAMPTAVFAQSVDGGTAVVQEALNPQQLEDGKYELYADMIKLDRESFSMANNGINHTVGLEVKDGEYYVTIQFKGLAIYNKYGYLKNLSYYDAGYSYGEYGVLQGSVTPAEVLSTQKNADGTDVIDKYNDASNLYPELVRIKLVDKASEEFVPLQVFVPIMEAIATGNGTQSVLMRLDWTQLKKTNQDIEIEKPKEQSPAVDLTDEQTGVRVQAEAGVFAEGVKLQVQEVSQGQAYEQAVKTLDKPADACKFYAITFADAAGNPVTTDAIFTVSYPVSDSNASTEVYRINSAGGATRMKGQSADGAYTVTFKGSDSVALCAVVQTVSSANVPAPTETASTQPGSGSEQPAGAPTNGEAASKAAVSGGNNTVTTNAASPKTADKSGLYASAAGLFASAGAFVMAARRKKKDTV